VSDNRETMIEDLADDLPDVPSDGPGLEALAVNQDEIPTGRDHEIPGYVGSPPSEIPSAPAWIKQVLSELDDTKSQLAAAMGQMVSMTERMIDTSDANTRMLKESIDGLRDEMRPRLANLETEGRQDRAEHAKLKQLVATLELEMADVKRRLSMLEEYGP
jgi:hypothetical protein